MTSNDDELDPGITWVVVASAERAEIYSRAKRFSVLEPVQTLEEPLARAREHELVSDSQGRVFDSGGRGRHAMEPDHTAKQHLRDTFARRIAEVLESGRGADRFQQLVIVAQPALLGALRGQLSSATKQRVVAEIDKHMTGQEPEAVASLIDGERR